MDRMSVSGIRRAELSPCRKVAPTLHILQPADCSQLMTGSYLAHRVVAGEAQEIRQLATKVIGALAEQALEGQARIRQLERELLA